MTLVVQLSDSEVDIELVWWFQQTTNFRWDIYLLIQILAIFKRDFKFTRHCWLFSVLFGAVGLCAEIWRVFKNEFLKSFDNFLTHSNSLFQEIFRTQKVTSLFQLICLSKVTQSERDNKFFCILYKCPVHYILPVCRWPNTNWPFCFV